MTTAIFDLDGCLSDDVWRRKHIPDYVAYNEECHKDQPMNLDVYLNIIMHVKHVIVVTARPETVKRQTLEWIQEHLPMPTGDFQLVMRPADDKRPSPELKVALLADIIKDPAEIAYAFDDRHDVLDAYRQWGISSAIHLNGKGAEHQVPTIDPHDLMKLTAAEILAAASKTYAERNSVYGDNYKNVAPVIKAMFPDGVPPELVVTDAWHLFELMVVKFTRFANSQFTHRDSIHDAAVYAAMIEAIVAQGEIKL